jgi:protein involved in polysaccharide export with SLBB domain
MAARVGLRIACLVAVLLAVEGGTCRPGLAQTGPPNSAVPPGQFATRDVPARPDPEAPLLAGPIDAATYLLGPGDVLNLILPGVIEDTVTLIIDAEGGLILPLSVGRVEVAGLTLAEAREEVGRALASIVRDRPFALSLEQPRRFKVYVTGQVADPGAYSASSVTRVSEVIELAGGIDADGSRRRIRIERTDGSELTADLALFAALGDQSSNPLLAGGDLVRVPVRIAEVAVFGGVASPGIYELGSRETAGSALALAGGPVPGAGLADATLSSIVSTLEGERRIFSLDLTGEDRKQALVAGDVLVVPIREADRRAVHRVEVSGEVTYPGRYPIKPGVDTVADLLVRAGGLTPEANRAGARLLRARPIAAAGDLTRPDVSGATGSRGPDTASDSEPALAETEAAPNFNDLPFTTRESEFLRRSEDGQEVRIAWREEPPGDATPLFDGDRLHVPRAEGRVRVDGRVRSPGFVPFAAGRTIDDYVALAGGFDRSAERGQLLVQRTGRTGFEAAKGARRIEDGDTIWVPEREPRNWWTAVREVATFAAQVATVVLIIDQAIH